MPIIISCLVCGKDFSPRASRRHTTKYCSRECYRSERRKGVSENPWTEEETIRCFWSNVTISSDDDCWIWKGGLDGNGYGIIRRNNKNHKTHRFSWIMANGEIPDGLFVLHRCDVRNCVNPKHLFIGTSMDNIVDMVMKNRHHNQILTPEQALAIRKDRRNLQLIADEYGISVNTVRSIRYRMMWKHLPD